MTDDELNEAMAEVMGWERDQGWSPATDYNDVFEVVERMRERGYWWAIRSPAGGSTDDERYAVRFETGMTPQSIDATGGRYVFAARRAHSLPRALCEAAVEAVRKAR